MRLHFCQPDGTSPRAFLRLVPPSAGHDLTWLIATRGQLPHERVSRALQEQLQYDAYVSTVEALHPDTDVY